MDIGNLMGALNTTSVGGTGAFENKTKIIHNSLQSFNKKIEL